MANSTRPFPIQLVNLEKKIASTFLTTVFIRGELFHLSLTSVSEKRFPGNGKLGLFLWLGHCSQGHTILTTAGKTPKGLTTVSSFLLAMILAGQKALQEN